MKKRFMQVVMVVFAVFAFACLYFFITTPSADYYHVVNVDIVVNIPEAEKIEPFDLYVLAYSSDEDIKVVALGKYFPSINKISKKVDYISRAAKYRAVYLLVLSENMGRYAVACGKGDMEVGEYLACKRY